MRKTKPKTPKPAADIWVIDLDSPGTSIGQFCASGPYESEEAAEIAIADDIINLWSDACTCLTSDKSQKWCKALHIVRVLRTVQPEISPTISLVNITPKP